MKVLIVTESLDLDSSSGAKCNTALINSFIEIGNEVTVLHYSHKEITISGALLKKIVEHKFNFLFVLSRVQRKLFRFSAQLLQSVRQVRAEAGQTPFVACQLRDRWKISKPEVVRTKTRTRIRNRTKAGRRFGQELGQKSHLPTKRD